MLQDTEVEVNSKYTPTFKSDDFVVLTEDCECYGDTPELDSRFFKKDRVCEVIECGLSHFFVDEESRFIQFVEDCEWCSVGAIIAESEHQFFDEDGIVEGVVRARYLRERTLADIIRQYSD